MNEPEASRNLDLLAALSPDEFRDGLSCENEVR
jgi:hypothetical protein